MMLIVMLNVLFHRNIEKYKMHFITLKIMSHHKSIHWPFDVVYFTVHSNQSCGTWWHASWAWNSNHLFHMLMMRMLRDMSHHLWFHYHTIHDSKRKESYLTACCLWTYQRHFENNGKRCKGPKKTKKSDWLLLPMNFSMRHAVITQRKLKKQYMRA